MRKGALILLLLTALFVIGCAEKESSQASKIDKDLEAADVANENYSSGTIQEEAIEDEREKLVNEQSLNENLIEGKTLSQRLGILKEHLHTPGSGAEAKRLFPDFVEVYVDYNKNPAFSQVIPFTYYYSPEAGITVSICNIGYTVFICQLKLDRLIKESDYDNCQITDAYFYPGK